MNLWVDGTYQNTERTEAETLQEKLLKVVQQQIVLLEMMNSDVESAGVGFGTKLSYEGFSLVATGFYATGLGMRGQHSVRQDKADGAAGASVGALDDVVKKENLTVDISKVHLILVKVLT